MLLLIRRLLDETRMDCTYWEVSFNRLQYAVARLHGKGLLNLASAMIRRFRPASRVRFLSMLSSVAHRMRSVPERLRVVQIETLSACNYACTFCPNGKITSPQGRMRTRLFLRLIDQLSAFDGSIHLYLRNEPLLDQRILTFARIAAARTRARVVIQTNGSRLTRQLAVDLSSVCTLIVNDYTDNQEIAQRVRSFGPLRRVMVVPRSPNERLSNRAGNLPALPVVKLDQFCVRPFEQMYVAFDGRVVLCCQDWRLEHVMGDANKDTLTSIWESESYRRVREQLLRHDRQGLCARCDFPGV